MSLTDEFPDLSSFLLYSDGLKPIFFIISKALKEKESSLRDAATNALSIVREIHSKGVRSSDFQYVTALIPVLLESLESAIQENQSHALWALAILVKQGRISKDIPSVSRFFATDNEDLLSKAIWVVQMLSHKGFDISEYIPHIMPLLQHPTYWIRHMAADAISEYKIEAGHEKRLLVRDTLHDVENLDSYWEVSVSHRRMHAKDTEPITQPDYIVHFTPERTCAVCGYNKAQCIFYWDDSGTGWRDRTSEYHCPECGKYTTYRYVD